MTNLERVKMEIKDINLTDAELEIYLMEQDLTATNEYTKVDNLQILKTTLAILESIANNPSMMKSYKTDDISVSNFSENIQSRIDQLNRKIRELEFKAENSGATFVNMFKF